MARGKPSPITVPFAQQSAGSSILANVPIRNTLFADPDSLNPPIGTITQPFLTFQAAIDYFEATAVASEQWLIINSPGKAYTETLTVTGADRFIEFQCESWAGGFLDGTITITTSESYVGLTNQVVSSNVSMTDAGIDPTISLIDSIVMGNIACTGAVDIICRGTGAPIDTGHTPCEVIGTIVTTGTIFAETTGFSDDITCARGLFNNCVLGDAPAVGLDIDISGDTLEFNDCHFNGLVPITFTGAAGIANFDVASYRRWRDSGNVDADVTNGTINIVVQRAAPVSIGTANSEGTSNALARADHVHNGTTILTASGPANVTKAAAAVGVATDAARSDHKHDITTAVVSSVGTANAEGSATSIARSDHIHALGDGIIVNTNLSQLVTLGNGEQGIPGVMRFVITAGGGGTFDDVTLVTAAFAYDIRVIDAWFKTTTAVLGSVGRVRSATANGGTLFAECSAATAILNRNTINADNVLAAGGDLYLHRTLNNFAGVLYVMYLRDS